MSIRVIAILVSLAALIGLGAWIYDAGGDARESKINERLLAERARADEQARIQRHADEVRDAELTDELELYRARLADLRANPPPPKTLIKTIEVPTNATTCPHDSLGDVFRLHYNAAASLQTGTNSTN